MQRSFKFFISLLALNLLLSGAAFSETYHVCVASYKNLKNAETMVQKLEKRSVEAFISEFKVKNENYYRILLAKEFKEITAARKYRDEAQSRPFAKELNLKGFWVCEGVPVIIKPNPEPEKVTVKEENPPAGQNLAKNEPAVLSEKTPYSVMVRSYKYSQFAENDKNRLNELGFNSYLVNTFDNETFFAFNVHVGVFAERGQAEELQAQFNDAGIVDTEISDFREIKAKIQEYDEIIAKEKVAFDDGETGLPESLSSSVKKLTEFFPANKDFPLTEITILDCENYRAADEKPRLPSKLSGAIKKGGNVRAVLSANYRDELYRKEVSVFLADADKFTHEGAFGEIENIQLSAPEGVFDCELYENENEILLVGENTEKNLFISMSTKDFSKEEFIDFLIDSFNNDSLSLYPQMRRTLFVLPDKNEVSNRDFIGLTFKKIGGEYSSERKNAEWTLPVVGHSLAQIYFTQKNSLLSLGLYDLDYDFNARKIHSHFIESKKAAESSGANNPVSVNGREAWYLTNNTQKEVSFSTKSYIIAVDAKKDSVLTQNDLIRLGSELKIWDNKKQEK